MANIARYIDAIRQAILGRDVRDSIASAISVINDVSERTITCGDVDPSGVPIYRDLLYLNRLTGDLWKSNSSNPYWTKIGNFEGRAIQSITKTSTDPETLVDTYTITYTKGSPATTTFEVQNGIGIVSIEKTSSDPETLIDTYTITYSNETTSTFLVGNGKGIASIAKTSSDPETLIDTYTITYNNGTTSTFLVGNGKGITNIVKTSSDPETLIDTYTIAYNDGTTSTYYVVNGKDGVTWYRGDAVNGKDVNPTIFTDSGISHANKGDFYLNYNEGAVYYCYTPGDPTEAAWAFDFIITGEDVVGVQFLNDLSDVQLSDKLVEGQVLMLNNNKWTNKKIEIPKVTVDQTYDPTSANPQSGVAVSEGIKKNNISNKGTYLKHFVNDLKHWGKCPTSFAGANVWTDGTNTYYSSGTKHYKLNGTTWEPMTWSGLTNFNGRNIWTDGTNIYKDCDYKLSGTTWEPVTFTNVPDIFLSKSVWTDGTNTYYSYGSTQLKLNGTTWEPMTWSGYTGNFSGLHNIWTDGVNIYLSDQSNQYKLNGTTWEPMTWSGMDGLLPNADAIFLDGTDIYYIYSTTSGWKLNGTTWEPVTWNMPYPHVFSPDDHYWTDGKNAYFSVLVTGQATYQYKFVDGDFEPVLWAGLDPYFYGKYLWTDGTNLYYSFENNQFKIVDNNFEIMSWSGLTGFYANHIWTDGENIYYSYDTIQYKLNGTTWEPMTWSGFTNLYGNYVWIDNETNDIFYDRYDSQVNDHYKLNSDGVTWESWYWKDWNNVDVREISGDGFWQYHNQVILSTPRWTGIRVDTHVIDYGMGDDWLEKHNYVNLWLATAGSVSARNVWTDGEDYYYSQGSAGCQLILRENNWDEIKFGNNNNLIHGYNIWTDGENIYHSDGTLQLKFEKFKLYGTRPTL